MPTVSQAGFFTLQALTDLGALAVGGRIYTFTQGTTTKKVAYTDAAGVVPHTYTTDSGGVEYIALNARGELPAPLYLTSGAYDITYKTSAGATVWTRRADPTGADLAASAGSASIGFIQAGSGAVARTAQAKMRESVSVLDFGATGDGTTNDATTIQAALDSGAKRVLLPSPATGYKITTKLTVPADVTLAGDNWRACRIFLGASVDMIELSDGGALENVYLDGQGATYTGRGIVISGTNGKQNLHKVRIKDTASACIAFTAVGAGSLFSATNLDLYRYNSSTGSGLYAVTIVSSQQLAATPRKFVNVETNGGCAFDFGGCNDTFVSNAFIGDLNFTADSRGVMLSNVRWANQAACTINGHNIVISGDIAPALTIASGADAINLMGCVYNSLPVTDSSGSGSNLISYWATAYAPTLTAGGVAPDLGNGTLTAKASRSGNRVDVFWKLTIGSTTTLGTGDLRISLPTWQPNYTSTVQVSGAANYNPSGASAGFYLGSHVIPASGSAYASLRRDTTNSVSGTAPGTAATGDIYQGTFSYILG